MKGQLKEGAFIFVSNIYSCLTEKEEIQKHSQTAIFTNQFVSELHSFVNYTSMGVAKPGSYHKTDNLSRDDCNLNSQCYNKQHKMSATIVQNA